MEIITSRERRRRWSEGDKLRILSEAAVPCVPRCPACNRQRTGF